MLYRKPAYRKDSPFFVDFSKCAMSGALRVHNGVPDGQMASDRNYQKGRRWPSFPNRALIIMLALFAESGPLQEMDQFNLGTSVLPTLTCGNNEITCGNSYSSLWHITANAKSSGGTITNSAIPRAVHQNLEHKAEHNNCRMRSTEPDF
jgi:hypothetical protein